VVPQSPLLGQAVCLQSLAQEVQKADPRRVRGDPHPAEVVPVDPHDGGAPGPPQGPPRLLLVACPLALLPGEFLPGLADTHPDPMHRPQPVGLLLGLVDLPQGLVRPLQDLELVLPEELLLATGKMLEPFWTVR